jgi:Holliday junction resolvase
MDKYYYIIYETKNLKNGKIYIGMHETDNLEDGYLGSGTRLKRAIRYYGREFFERRILHIFNNKEDMISNDNDVTKISDNEDLVGCDGGACSI